MNKFRIQAVNMNKYFLSIITILVIIAQTLTGDLSAFAEGASEKNNNNDLFIHTEENPIKIWGWSRDGIVGISELKASNSGGTTIGAFVLNAVTDTILWEQTIASHFNEYDGYYLPENEFTAFFSNFQNVCRLYGIEIQETRLMVPSGSAFRHNRKTFNVIINADIIDENDWTKRYSVTAETGGKRKTILPSKDTSLANLPSFSLYSISPFEERALIIIRLTSMSHWFGFDYAGCHLSIGF